MNGGVSVHPLAGDPIEALTFSPLAADITTTLQDRGKRYGSFIEHARISQAIKKAMADSPNWATLSPDKREALEMLAHKAARILNSDPEYHDSWHDIVGYSKLVADALLAKTSGG
jgi:hypothetical protein